MGIAKELAGCRYVKILIIDDHALFRAGLRMLMSTLDAQLVCLETGSIAGAHALLSEHEDLRLCILDLSLNQESGISAIRTLKELRPSLAVVIVSGTEDPGVVRECIDAGAMSYIPKSMAPDVLTDALRHVLRGEVHLPASVAARLDAAAARPHLSPRQADVLHCLNRGLPTKLIAVELGLSEYTVKEYLGAIFQALGVRNRTEAVIKAARLQLAVRPST
ncbi:MAG: response regulator transcription factor [Proteobacteria bacterium]|nr:response regulator transcription factor [Pseudomonadota bacterium]